MRATVENTSDSTEGPLTITSCIWADSGLQLEMLDPVDGDSWNGRVFSHFVLLMKVNPVIPRIFVGRHTATSDYGA